MIETVGIIMENIMTIGNKMKIMDIIAKRDLTSLDGHA
jgi:hypothetical protein